VEISLQCSQVSLQQAHISSHTLIAKHCIISSVESAYSNYVQLAVGMLEMLEMLEMAVVLSPLDQQTVATSTVHYNINPHNHQHIAVASQQPIKYPFSCQPAANQISFSKLDVFRVFLVIQDLITSGCVVFLFSICVILLSLLLLAATL
jgi:hypothetical protein